MKKISLILFLFVFIPTAYAQEVVVAAAANLQFVLEDLKNEFSAQTGIGIKSVMGSSGKLSLQIEQGAPFDVFMSADAEFPQHLYDKGRTLGAPRIYAYGHLVLWTWKSMDLSQGLNVLKNPAIVKIAIASPKAAPYGRGAIHAFNNAHLYAQVEHKLIYAESIAQVNEFVVSKAVDVGLTSKSVVLAENMKDKGKWVEVDPHLYEPIAQSAVLLKDDSNARKFYEFLFSSKAKEIFQKYGYT